MSKNESIQDKIGTWSIYYDANKGYNAPPPQTTPLGKGVIISSTIPYRSGYTFLGWAKSSTAISATYSPGGYITSSTNVTLYAVWQYSSGGDNSCVLKFKLAGGSDPGGYFGDKYTSYGGMLQIPSVKPSRAGYVFRYWTEDPLGGTTIYDPGNYITLYKDVALYAIWTKEIQYCTITYDLNGGSGYISADRVAEGETIYLTNEIPIRPGYEFIGWSNFETATTAHYKPGQAYKVWLDVVLYAVWKKRNSIYLGSKPVDAIYIGSKEITAAYLGAMRIW